MIAVSNSTPLIALSKIDQLWLLREFFGLIFIPEEVHDEVVLRGDSHAGAAEVASCSWIQTEQVINRLAVDALCISLDRGEAEAIVLSREKEALLLIDDGDGRKAARQLGLRITGTVGILLLASAEGMIDLKKSLDELRSEGFRLGNREYEKILALDTCQTKREN